MDESRRKFLSLTGKLAAGGMICSLAEPTLKIGKAMADCLKKRKPEEVSIYAVPDGLKEKPYHLLTPDESENPILMLKSGEDFNLRDPAKLRYRVEPRFGSNDTLLNKIIADGKISAEEGSILLENSLEKGIGNYFGWIQEPGIDATRFTVMPDFIGLVKGLKLKNKSLENKLGECTPKEILESAYPLNSRIGAERALEIYQNTRDSAEKALIDQSVANYVAINGNKLYAALTCLYYKNNGSFTQSGLFSSDKSFGMKGKHIRKLDKMYINSQGALDTETTLKLMLICDEDIALLDYDQFKKVDRNLKKGEYNYLLGDFRDQELVAITNNQGYGIIEGGFNGTYDNQKLPRIKQRMQVAPNSAMYTTNNFYVQLSTTPDVKVHKTGTKFFQPINELKDPSTNFLLK